MFYLFIFNASTHPSFNELLLYDKHYAKGLKIKRHWGFLAGRDGMRKKREREKELMGRDNSVVILGGRGGCGCGGGRYSGDKC